jgi:hypothetical protein
MSCVAWGLCIYFVFVVVVVVFQLGLHFIHFS